MSFNTGSTNTALRPDDHGAAYYQNLLNQSVALQVSTLVYSNSTVYRIPVNTATPNADWVAEGSAITATDPTMAEVTVVPRKLAALTHISGEMLADSANQAATVVTVGMGSDLAKKIDLAFFGSPANANAPDGLNDVVGINEINLVGADFTNLDPFLGAIADAQAVNEQIESFVASPLTSLKLALLKQSTGSNVPLLQPDVTAPGRNIIAGVPLYVSAAVAEDVVWALPRRAVTSVIRTPAEIAFSNDFLFNQDMVSVRLTQRIAFGVSHAAAISKITANAV